MARFRMTLTNVLPLALALALGVSCSAADDDANGDSLKAGSGSKGAANSGGSAAQAGKTGQGSGTGGAGGARASGSGGRVAAGEAGSSGKGGGAGGTQSNDAGAPSGCMNGSDMIPDGATIAQPDGCNTCTCNAGSLQCTTIACAAEECVVARHLDTCCATYEPVLRSALAADECLVAYPATGLDQALVQRCLPTTCTAGLCADEDLASRIAKSDGKGGCSYADECQNDEDCALASDARKCCSCVESMPRALLASNLCLMVQSTNTAALRANPCPMCTSTGTCGACSAPPASAKCIVGDAPYDVCR